jgi:hypothetical protein
MKRWIVGISFALAVFTTVSLGGLAKPAAAAANCEQFTGEFVFSSFFFTSATTAVGEGSVSGDISGTFHADYFDIVQHGEGAIEAHATHTITTAEGTLVTSDQIRLLPDREPGVVGPNSRLSVVAGTGRYESATGLLHTHGEVNLTTLDGAIGFKGQICLA